MKALAKSVIPWNLVQCPECLAAVKLSNERVICINSECSKEYPIVNDIPVLINQKNSVFSFDDFKVDKATFFKKRGNFIEWLNKNSPSISHNIAAKRNYTRLSELALKENSSARILVIGGSIAGQGFEVLSNNPAFELVETDVSFGPRVGMICDAHDLPFVDCSFDIVIAQAVLEHVVDPIRCVGEIHRVLKSDGLVYAETPFMQQVHGGSYDFMRFTYRGHRRLFRQFHEVDAGISGGPGMALAWSWQYFLRSFARTKRGQMFLASLGRLSSFYLKYFDYLFKNTVAVHDAASGFYFIGKKSIAILNDKDLVGSYNVRPYS
jgi:SAM-dependent methyltransferase